MDETPDYRSMSRADLEDVARHINREAFPERWAIVRDELRRRAEEPLPSEPRRAPRAWPWQRIIAISQFVGALAAIGYLGVALTLPAGDSDRQHLDPSFRVRDPQRTVYDRRRHIQKQRDQGHRNQRLRRMDRDRLHEPRESFVIVNVLAAGASIMLLRLLRTRIRPMHAAELAAVAALATAVFDESIAPTYSAEGIASYRDYATAASFASRVNDHRLLVAERGGEIVGMLELRGDAHVSMLFVSSREQRRGIGRMLLAAADAMSDVEILTLNATPNAVPAYVRLGFEATGEEQERNGIRFVPMSRRKCGK